MINKNTTVSCLLGLLTGLLVYHAIDSFIIDVSESLTTSDAIDLITLGINLIIGVAIVLIIQKKLSDDRGVKDYFIKEINDILDDYRAFNNKLFQGKLDANYILQWYKAIAVKINHLDFFLKKDLKIKDLPLRGYHRAIQLHLTDTKGFNDSFKQDCYKPPIKDIHRVTDLYKELKSSFIDTIIKINRA